MNAIMALAFVIAGEVGTGGYCDASASLAVPWVIANRAAIGIEGGWYGWSTPDAATLEMARTWQQYPDPTHGATHFFSDQDVAQAWVQAYLAAGNFEMTWHAECAVGGVSAWAKSAFVAPGGDDADRVPPNQ